MGLGVSRTHTGLRGAGLLPCSLWRSCSRSGSPVADPARCGRWVQMGWWRGLVDHPQGRGKDRKLPRARIQSPVWRLSKNQLDRCALRWTPLGSPPPERESPGNVSSKDFGNLTC